MTSEDLAEEHAGSRQADAEFAEDTGGGSEGRAEKMP